VKILKLKNIKSFILTVINVLKIFIISFFRYNQNNSSKFIFFYFPLKAYQENLIELVKLLNKKDNVYVYVIYNSLASDEVRFKKNSLFIDFGYLRFIPLSNFFLSKINFLISSYVLYIFLPNTKNIYISHDIYDAPMVNKKIEKKLFIELSKLDHIFVSSLIVKKYFEEKLKKYVKYKKYLKTKITNTGYLKLDHVTRILKNKKNKESHILIAPTGSNFYKNLNLSSNLLDMIYFLLKKKYKIIYRPHPMDLTKKGNNQLVKNVIEKFKYYDNFKTDLSSSYLKSYLESRLLITDFSGTAYTYSFSTNKPVIFFSKNNYSKLFSYFKKSNYFQDRKEIGYIVNSLQNLDNKLIKLNKSKNIFSDKIKKLKNKRIQYFGNSLNITKREIEKLF
tara:strand:- start:781 stop:1956 length:1176 start_codon:yes stop_codon:yes gene_type:complete